MYRIAPLVALLCLVTLLSSGCGPGQALPPTAVPSQPKPTVAPPTPTAEATDTPLPAASVAGATSLPPAAVPTDTAPPSTPVPAPALSLSSTAFAPGGEIPVKNTCFGDNLSPSLDWSGVPEGTESLALVVDDPDSQPPGFVHWVVYNLPATASGLPEGLAAQGELEDGTLQGTNDFSAFKGQTFPSGAAINGVGYDGPCPPGRHRYVLTLYALDVRLDLPAEATASEVLAAMQGHMLTQALLAGVFTPPQ